MKVLLVGGTGVLSSEIMNLSVSLGHDVYVINRGNRKKIIPEKVHLLQSDINDHKKVGRLIKKLYFDVVVDFLCFTKKQVENSISIFKNSCKQYIFISSCAVYDIGNGSVECTEKSPLVNPLWQYSIDKVECEKALPSLCEQYDIQYTIIRPAVTYGNTRIPYGIMPSYGYHWTLVARILNDKPVLVWDDGKNILHITRVEDFAKGAVALFGNKKAYKQAFHIVGDDRYQWIDVVNTLGEILGKNPIVVSVTKELLAKEMPSRKGEILGGRGIDLLLDNSKIKSVVHDFKTTISLKEGLKKTINHYQNNNYLSGIDYVFDATIDRIIHRYYARNNPKRLKEFNLYYIDYLKTGRSRDRILYFLYRHSDPMLAKVLTKCYNLFLRGHRLLQQR